MPYTLTINIDSQGLTQIANASEYVTIVQYVTQYAQSMSAANVKAVTMASTQLSVAWLSFSPFNNNTVVWTNSYAIFATNGAPSIGTPVTMSSQTPVAAQLGWTYTLQNGTFTAASGNGSGYIVSNQQSSSSGSGIYFGLAAQATVNNTPQSWQPMNAFFVPYNQSGWFLPAQQISIFVSTCSTNGTAIPALGGGTTIDFSSASTATVQFNDTTNAFVQTS